MAVAPHARVDRETDTKRSDGTAHTAELSGWTIGVTADRRAQQQIRLLEQRGATTMWGPAMRTIDLSEAGELFAVTDELIAEPPDVLVLQTGQGASWWFDALERTGRGTDELRSTLGGTTIVCRGAKATSAARRLQLDVDWQAPNEVASEIVEHLRERGVSGERVAVQLDGGETSALDVQLGDLGAQVVTVPVYRWARPHDPAPVHRLIGSLVDGKLDAVTFTATPAVRAVTELVGELGLADAFRDRIDAGGVLAVCVGPVCAASAAEHGWRHIIQPPDRPRLVSMLDELSRHAIRVRDRDA